MFACFVFIVLPVLAQDGGLVPCDGADCNVNAFFALANNIVRYFVFTLAVPAAVIAITYAGITRILHPKESGKLAESNGIIMTAVIGLALALGAWLIVTTITNYLLNDTLKSNINQSLPSGT